MVNRISGSHFKLANRVPLTTAIAMHALLVTRNAWQKWLKQLKAKSFTKIFHRILQGHTYANTAKQLSA